MDSDQDFQLWIYLYVEKRFSCQWISDQTNVPVSTIKKLTIFPVWSNRVFQIYLLMRLFIDMAISSQAKGIPLEGSETTGEVESS